MIVYNENTPFFKVIMVSGSSKETIYNCITHDNPSIREVLKNMYSFVSQLLPTDDVKIA